jgi:GT2 family glycosyltransferase
LEIFNPVLMLCRNAVELSKRAADSILAQDIHCTLYVINNNSNDGTNEWLENRPEIRQWMLHTPRGVSASWNFGLEYLFNVARAPHVLVVNNDVELRPDTYRSLIEDGGQFVTAVSVDNRAGMHGEWRNSRRPHPDFSCFLIRRETWWTVGLFDTRMVHYASDADYHLRMHQAGIEAYTIGVPFYHYASGTLKQATGDERDKIRRQADNDRAAFEAKWGCKVGSPQYYEKFGHGSPE